MLQTPTSNSNTSQNTNSFGNNPIYLFSRDGSQFFNAGEIDDLRIYNQALSAAEIQQLYQAGNASLVSIAVTPANPSIAKGATQQFTATGTYSDNSTQNLTSSVTWNSSSTSVATITSAGLATGAATGTTTISATSGSISGSTNLTVTPAVLESIAVTPANASINNGATQQFTATGTYSDGSMQNLTSSVTWNSSSTSVATITSGGLVTGVGTGSTTISATSGSISGSTNLSVVPVGQGFAYRRAVTLTNPGPTLTNYQVKITLSSSNMNFSHAQSNGGDIRFLASDGLTNLPYWIENWNSTSQVAILWVNVPSIPNGTSTIYLVYGNSSVTTSGSGTNTFLFFDDFSVADPSTLNGYYNEGPPADVNLGPAQSWEGSDVPHFFSVMTNPFGETINGTTYTYWAWYSLHSSTNSGIGLAGSNDLVNWTKYTSNPVITAATGCGRPSVILVSTTLNMACQSTSVPFEINYFTSTDGITWTAQTAFTALTYNATNPQLWQNPTDNNYYLFYVYKATGYYNVINYRSASTVAGLETAVDNTIINVKSSGDSSSQLYAPFVGYDSASGLYVMQVEDLPNNDSESSDSYWYVATLTSPTIAGPWTAAAGSPQHAGGYGCPERYNFGGTLYTYYCHYNGTAWTIQYTTANVSSGLKQYPKPQTSLWTEVHDPTDTAPSWYLTPCTDWKGSSATCLYGFGSLTGANYVSPTLQSSYSGTNYILDAQVYAIEAYDAQIGTRMRTTPGNYYSNELYVNSNGGDNFYIAYKHPAWVQVVAGTAGDLFLNTWYQLEANPQGTTQEASTQYGASSVSGTDSNYSSGAAGPSLDNNASTMFGYLFIRQNASVVPANSVGSETLGNFP